MKSTKVQNPRRIPSSRQYARPARNVIDDAFLIKRSYARYKMRVFNFAIMRLLAKIAKISSRLIVAVKVQNA